MAINWRASRHREFERAALPHMGDLFRTASRLTGDRTQAEDLVQEAYLQAWKSFDRFELGSNCRAWLFKILFYVVHHHWRKASRMKLVEDSGQILEQTLKYEPPVPQQLSDAEVLDALETLPANYREVLLLADVEELSYKEAAETLNIPIGTVMSRLSRGRALLRERLVGYAEEHGVKPAKGKGRAA